MYRNEGKQPLRPSFFSLRAAKRQENEPSSLFGVLSTNGDDWSNFRKAVQAPVMRKSYTDKHLEHVETISHEFLSYLDAKDNLDNFNEDIYKWALESIASIALDVRLQCFSENVDDDVVKMIRSVQGVLELGKKLDLGLRLWEWFPSKDYKLFHQHYTTFKQAATKYVAGASLTNNGKSMISDLKR